MRPVDEKSQLALNVRHGRIEDQDIRAKVRIPRTRGMKTSHFEGSVVSGVRVLAQGRDERTQRLRHSILTLADHGWSQRRIALKLDINRETVGKYVRLGQPIPAISTSGSEGKVTPGFNDAAVCCTAHIHALNSTCSSFTSYSPHAGPRPFRLPWLRWQYSNDRCGLAEAL